MSYILEALKKSEAERSSTEQAELAHRVPFAATPRRQRAIWPYLLMLALMANALVIGYVVWPESGSEPPVPEVTRGARVSGETADASAPIKTEHSPSKSAAAPSTNETADGQAAEERAASPDPPAETAPVKSKEAAGTTDATTEIPAINAMPRSVQQKVPEMTFNGHVWSSTPSSRKVMINNRMLGEGARVGDLVIREITPAGVVFRLGQHVFRMAIVRDWQGGS